ncbi:hypothetical protein FS764_18770 [Agrobacterium vitis]|nr:hypothetical protein [Agrobacterium vitis]
MTPSSTCGRTMLGSSSEYEPFGVPPGPPPPGLLPKGPGPPENPGGPPLGGSSPRPPPGGPPGGPPPGGPLRLSEAMTRLVKNRDTRNKITATPRP